MADPLKLDEVETKSVFLRTNPVEESIEIITDEDVLQAVIFDINGRKLGQYGNQKILPAGDLNKGIYFLRITTNIGITNVRFIKL